MTPRHPADESRSAGGRWTHEGVIAADGVGVGVSPGGGCALCRYHKNVCTNRKENTTKLTISRPSRMAFTHGLLNPWGDSS